jgi:hypothetical protein
MRSEAALEWLQSTNAYAKTTKAWPHASSLSLQVELEPKRRCTVWIYAMACWIITTPLPTVVVKANFTTTSSTSWTILPARLGIPFTKSTDGSTITFTLSQPAKLSFLVGGN